jgi:co-chaperonin GroES (HSP10)
MEKVTETAEVAEETTEISFVPVDDCVVVEIENVGNDSSIIKMTDEYLERKKMTIVEGILRKSGSLAFYDLIKYEKEHPQPGHKVYFKKYSGILHSDKESGREFRVIRDQDIYAFEEVANE